jgi:hypothetical protein
VSLIDYVVGHLLKQEPEVLAFASDFANLDNVKHVSFINISTDVAKVSTGLSIVSKLIDASEGDGSSVENIEKLKSVSLEINKAVSNLERKCEDAVQAFNKTCAFLGEPVSNPETLFGQLQEFLGCVAKSSKDLQTKAKKVNNAPPPSLKNIF